MLFETNHLIVRRITADDLDAMCAVYGDVDAMRWVADGTGLGRDGCARWTEKTLRNYATRGYGMSALVLKEGGTVIGFCGLVHADGRIVPEIKYALRREYWGRGLASEAARGMLEYGSRAFGLRKIIATTDPDNLASHRVLIKAGMTDAGVRRNDDGTFTRLFAWHAADGLRCA
ncbi:MAG: GNAT family N-acetyltransferase [Gemmatimonadota bacterium]